MYTYSISSQSSSSSSSSASTSISIQQSRHQPHQPNQNTKSKIRHPSHRSYSSNIITSVLSKTSLDILSKINHITHDILSKLNQETDPSITFRSSNTSTIAIIGTSTMTTKSINNLSTCRSYTSTLLILSYIQTLIQRCKSTTTREIYYHYVTHFRSQRECDNVINEVCLLLQVNSRAQLGLYASPKGWFCGSIVIKERKHRNCHHSRSDVDWGNNDIDDYEVEDNYNVISGMTSSSNQGIPITREWIMRSHSSISSSSSQLSSTSNSRSNHDFTIQSNAKCILVVEKEGIFLRLTEDRFHERYPCIIVTGKGYPDIATRALVHVLHNELGPDVPIYGICDCNPFGVSVLQTFYKGSDNRHGDGGDRYSVPIQWIGLKPSFVYKLKEQNLLPKEVFQMLTDLDKKKIEKLCHESNDFIHRRHDYNSRNIIDYDDYVDELESMTDLGLKVELESLNWLGIDYITGWLLEVLISNEKYDREDI